MEACIVIAGGAINPAEGEYQDGVVQAIEVGSRLLTKGKSALDVVEEVARQIEDNPLFNCGTGARLNLKGQVEMDACIMDGRALRSGAVASIQNIKNPVLVARKVMEETDHCLLVGGGAETFARALGFEKYDPLTEAKREEWRNLIDAMRSGKELPARYAAVLRNFNKLKDWLDDDTVGVIAMDRQGDLAAATSSGGGPLKMPGRVGDVPLIGSGIYVDNRAGGAVLTGNGEAIVRHLAGKMARDLMAEDWSAQETAEKVVAFFNEREPKAVVSILTLDKTGRIGGARNVDTTPHAGWREKDGGIQSHFATVMRQA